MIFKSLRDLEKDIEKNLFRIPANVDLVVGIPRSGMLVASMIALLRNLPLVDIDGFCAGRVFESGSTRGAPKAEGQRFFNALVVDDSSHTGNSIREAKEKISAATAKLPKITTCVVYGTTKSEAEVDLVMVVIDQPRIFQWNVLHHPKILANACLDIDGVLCHDPEFHENDDGRRYSEFVRDAKTLHIPSHYVGALVTSRLEKYRASTMEWLEVNKIEYGELIMLDLPDAETRRRLGSHAKHKADYYKRSSATLFIESELLQANQIASLSGKPVLSLEGPEMCLPKPWSAISIGQNFTNKRLLARRLRGIIGDRAVNKLRDIYLKSTKK